VTWTAFASGGFYSADGVFSTNVPGTSIQFTFSEPVNAVAGTFFATAQDFTVIPALFVAILSDGTTWANLTGPDVARAVARLPRLRSLHLIDVAIGDDGLDVLTELSALRNLYLDGAGVSDAAWERYFEARPRIHVHVDQAHHDRDPRREHD
jgi:hypothetical protein